MRSVYSRTGDSSRDLGFMLGSRGRELNLSHVVESPVVRTFNKLFVISDIPNEVNAILIDKDSVSLFSKILFS